LIRKKTELSKADGCSRERDQDKEETKANFLTSCHSTFYFLWLERGGDGKRPVNTVGKGNVLARYTVVAVSVLFPFLVSAGPSRI
jgi:hypothetical protein